MLIEVLSLFPAYIEGPLRESMLRRAIQNGLLSVSSIDIRSFSSRKDLRVDDRPCGGGPGMVMMAEPVVSAIRSRKKPDSRVVYLSPQGQKLTPDLAKRLAKVPHLILLCGHYEGIDQRAIDSDVDEEVSIGDYVLTNGCLAALVLIDVVARFIPGVLGHEEAALLDSFENGLFDHPHYTKPNVFEGREVPEVLLSGDHAKVDAWRKEQAFLKTLERRPDLIKSEVTK
jgi:tRNA (guanine37-N1)-methyltransferase